MLGLRPVCQKPTSEGEIVLRIAAWVWVDVELGFHQHRSHLPPSVVRFAMTYIEDVKVLRKATMRTNFQLQILPHR
jgi:hypothetical protein